MLYKSVDGKNVPLSEQEEAEVRAEWAASEAKEAAQKTILEIKELREKAIQALLEDLLEKNPSLPTIKNYLDRKAKK